MLPWNNLAILEARLSRGDVAAVIMEPAMCNTSAISPAQGYLEGVRKICSETETILIFDEIITGFRLAPGGAQQRLGVIPDLATFGKAIANGFPVSALAGRRDLMEQMATGGVLHGGSYNALPAAMAAVVATLNELNRPETSNYLEEQGKKLMIGIKDALADADVEAQVQGFPKSSTSLWGPAHHFLTTAILWQQTRRVMSISRPLYLLTASARSNAALGSSPPPMTTRQSMKPSQPSQR